MGDILSISNCPKITIEGIKHLFKLKGDKSEEPTSYLGSYLSKILNEDGVKCWAMPSEKYCLAVVANIKKTLDKRGRWLPSKCVTPMASGYKPETDITAELKANVVQWFQEMIG